MLLPADNVAWEDPRIDQHLLRMGAEDTLLVLTTGGCNVLDRLIDGTKHIVAADLNAAQNALLELKLACLRVLTYEQFFQLFAQSNRRLFDSLYASTLRPLLSGAAACYWDANGKAFFDNVLYAGASGKLARALVGLSTLAGLGPMFRALATCASLEEQRKVTLPPTPSPNPNPNLIPNPWPGQGGAPPLLRRVPGNAAAGAGGGPADAPRLAPCR